jgi:hypothetical protein
MTISTALADLNTSVANLTGAINTLLLAAATAGTDVSASLATLTASIEAEAANVDGVTAAVAAVPTA